MKRIVLTGGGTAGHVTPNIALLPSLRELGYEIHYIGSYEGIESKLIADFDDVTYYGIATGKFRRYIDPKNLSDPFRVVKGYAEARKLLKKIKPDIVFSKGGYVSVPVVRAAASLKIPCIIHESDMTPGLANKLCIPVATKICCNFPETIQYMDSDKTVLTGSPIRDELSQGDKNVALTFCGFEPNVPVVMVIGGSLGAMNVNKAVREALPELLKDFQVVHICGKDKVDNTLLTTKGYKQFEYVKDELKDIFALADVVISRAGANSICEILSLQKPNLLIPLMAGSRGDQILNAASFESSGYSKVLSEDDITTQLLVDTVHELYFNKKTYIDAMSRSHQKDAIKTIIKMIEDTVGKKDES